MGKLKKGYYYVDAYIYKCDRSTVKDSKECSIRAIPIIVYYDGKKYVTEYLTGYKIPISYEFYKGGTLISCHTNVGYDYTTTKFFSSITNRIYVLMQTMYEKNRDDVFEKNYSFLSTRCHYEYVKNKKVIPYKQNPLNCLDRNGFLGSCDYLTAQQIISEYEQEHSDIEKFREELQKLEQIGNDNLENEYQKIIDKEENEKKIYKMLKQNQKNK